MLLSTMALGQNPDQSLAVESLVVTPDRDSVEFLIGSTEWVRYTYFNLEGPRVVVDFHNAGNALGFSRKAVDHAGVDQVRASFFSDSKREVTRLVFDLEEETPYEVVDDGEGQVRVRFGVLDHQESDPAGIEAGDRLANLGDWGPPTEPGLFDVGGSDTEETPLSDALAIDATANDTSTSGEAAVLDLIEIDEIDEDNSDDDTTGNAANLNAFAIDTAESLPFDAPTNGAVVDDDLTAGEAAVLDLIGIEEDDGEDYSVPDTARLNDSATEAASIEAGSVDSGETILNLASDASGTNQAAPSNPAPADEFEPEQPEILPNIVQDTQLGPAEADFVVETAVEVVEVDEGRAAIAQEADGSVRVQEAGGSLRVVESDRVAPLEPIPSPILTSEIEAPPTGQGLLASILTSAEFEIHGADPSIVVEELGSPAPVPVNPGALATPVAAPVPPQSEAAIVAEAAAVGGIAAAPPASSFLGQAIEAPATPQYTGEIATFDFRNLDLQDFFRLIGDISGLNVVLDPAVNGTVTLLLRAVPWDQALDVVLRNNNLGYELEGNVLRIATRATLQAEEDAARQLRDAQELNAPLVTETFILSYTQSATVSAIIQDLLSTRGTIITDARRNALIVTDIPSQFGRVNSLVSFLDTPAQQVEIEARLLSASKSFSRDLGTQIGLLVGNNSQNAVTGLPGAGSPFTRTPTPGVNIGGAVPLITDFPAGGTSGLSFLLGAGGDILLDTIIQAAEATGTAKLLSRPRVTTQNNQSATVSQGTQIPVQTNVNNTITVTFVDFSLSLTVTPQITEAGTILLTAVIDNSSPDFGRSVNGIPSVSSQQATTQVLIPDGGTAVVGGILLDNDSINVSQVPGLGNIPVLGNLFKSTQVIKSTSELLFFITARIKPANPLEFLSETSPEESSQLLAQ